MIGDATAGSKILLITWSKCTPCIPAPTHTAPISPPNSACEELEGSPISQVARFHRIAPTSPAKMIAGVASLSLTIPLEMVWATFVDRHALARLSTQLMSAAAVTLWASVSAGAGDGCRDRRHSGRPHEGG